MIRLFENSVANTRNVCSLNFLDNEAMVNVINKIDDQDNRNTDDIWLHKPQLREPPRSGLGNTN